MKLKASVFASSGRVARLVAKYKPTMPVLALVIPRLTSNPIAMEFYWCFSSKAVAMDHRKALGIDYPPEKGCSVSTRESG